MKREIFLLNILNDIFHKKIKSYRFPLSTNLSYSEFFYRSHILYNLFIFNFYKYFQISNYFGNIKL